MNAQSTLRSAPTTLVTHTDAAEGATQIARALRADLFHIDCAFYLAGPGRFVDVLATELHKAGVPSSQIHAEVTP